MTDEEFQKLKGAIENLEKKVDRLTALTEHKPSFIMWRQFWVGFGIVFVVMMIFFVTIGLFGMNAG